MILKYREKRYVWLFRMETTRTHVLLCEPVTPMNISSIVSVLWFYNAYRYRTDEIEQWQQ